MKRKHLEDWRWDVVMALSAMLIAGGCMTRTVIAGGKRSASRCYSSWTWGYGAYGQSYTSRTDKVLEIGISEWSLGQLQPPVRPQIPELRPETRESVTGEVERVLFSKQIKLKAVADLGFDSEWHGDTNVTFYFYETDPNAATIEEIDASRRPLRPPAPSELSLCLNPLTGLFEECR